MAILVPFLCVGRVKVRSKLTICRSILVKGWGSQTQGFQSRNTDIVVDALRGAGFESRVKMDIFHVAFVKYMLEVIRGPQWSFYVQLEVLSF
jgi:hypothetical protein